MAPATSALSRVVFNVGGRRFETTEQTLLDEREADPPVAEVFIDRDPSHFESVLNFLRNGHLPPNASEATIICLEKEAQYYGLSELANLCRALREPVKLNEAVQWQEDAIEAYWRSYVKCVVDPTLIMPFTYERNSHFLAKCIACGECFDPKSPNVFNIYDMDDWVALAHHMRFMSGKIEKMGD
ncbi:Protein F18A11.5 b [Aphelenchoides avenae]|nr:Protein F18A11.5 b [Aphelenchus avenae]